jgi:hypothetical protein
MDPDLRIHKCKPVDASGKCEACTPVISSMLRVTIPAAARSGSS